ncbi:ABC transporter substrate-binding protein [Diaminobutyricimonas sp. LJ205]|uniref:ABC transporter substrate-binding protein n=1 Tax=Diaminobutyricimonas sp. LJ205 TaxID=2683590 RepID=UPI0012F4B0E8|nr:ABC transporter substrate-binding protein [Diaminobutyricimonas sp. LJ205]
MERLAFTGGFAEDRGVQLDSTYDVVSGKEIVAALLNGTAQFGSLTTLATGPLVEQGECFRYLTAGQRNIYEFIASPELGLDDSGSYPQNLAGLKGKKIGVSALGTLGEELARYVLSEAGLKPDDVTFVATGGVASAIAAFQEGQVDATWSFAPMLQILDESEYTRLTDFVGGSDDPVIGKYVQHALGTTCEYADAHPDVVKAVCQSVWDAFDYAADPANSKAMGMFFVDSLALDPDVAQAYWDAYSGTYPTAAITKADWAALDDLLATLDVAQPAYADHVEPVCAGSDPR